MTRRRPPQRGQARTSRSNTRRISAAQVHRSFKEIAFIQTGVGTHGLYPSRDGTKLYVANRGSNHLHDKPHGKGNVSVVDFATRNIVATWPIPGGGSPDMGNVSADGKVLWLSGRYDDVVYAIDTTSGEVRKIAVGKEPHGSRSGPSRVATRSAIPGTCGSGKPPHC